MKTMLPLAACAIMVTLASACPPQSVLSWRGPGRRMLRSRRRPPSPIRHRERRSRAGTTHGFGPQQSQETVSEPSKEPAATMSTRTISVSSVTPIRTCGRVTRAHLLVTPQLLAGDIHWQKGIKCQQCHGGNASTLDLLKAACHRGWLSQDRITRGRPEICGFCHANAEYMQRFRPDAAADIIEKFSASVHGKHLQAAGGLELLLSQGRSRWLAGGQSCVVPPPASDGSVSDPLSALNPRNLAQTCGACHRDQLVGVRKSVHAKAGEKDELGREPYWTVTSAMVRMGTACCRWRILVKPWVGKSNGSLWGVPQGLSEDLLESVHGTGLICSPDWCDGVRADCHDAIPDLLCG